MTSNSMRTECEKCDPGFITRGTGSVCQSCPPNTVPSVDQTRCVPKDQITWKSETTRDPLVYYSWMFSTSQTKAQHNKSLGKINSVCKSQGPYCSHGFYGPVFQTVSIPNVTTTFQNQYFISPQDIHDFSTIGDLELEQAAGGYTGKSFIVGLFDQKEVQHYSTQQKNQKGQQSTTNSA